MIELMIAMVLGLLLICFLLEILASKQKYFPEHLAITIFGMFAGLAACLLGEEGMVQRRVYFLEFSEKVFFVLLAPPIFLEAGYSLNRHMFFHHTGAIIALGVIGSYVSIMLFAAVVYFVINNVWACGLDVPISFHQCVRLAAMLMTTDTTALLRIFSNILPEHLQHKLAENASVTTKTGVLTSIVIGESLANDGVGIAIFWHTGPYAIQQAMNFFLVPFVFVFSFAVGIFVALVCSVITKHVDMEHHPEIEFLISFAFALMSYFLFIEFSFVNEFVSLYSCGFAMAHYNFKNLSNTSKITSRAMIKSWSWASFTFIYFQMGVILSVSLYAERPYWKRALPLISLVTMAMLLCRGVVVAVICAALSYLNLYTIGWREQIILNLAAVRGALSYALCLVWRGKKLKSSLVTTTTLGVVIITNFVLGSAVYPAIATLFPEYRLDANSVVEASHHMSSDDKMLSPVCRHRTPGCTLMSGKVSSPLRLTRTLENADGKHKEN